MFLFIDRTATARGKAEQADVAGSHAREDSAIARLHAKQFAPDFLQPGESVGIGDNTGSYWFPVAFGASGRRHTDKAGRQGRCQILGFSDKMGITECIIIDH